MADGDH